MSGSPVEHRDAQVIDAVVSDDGGADENDSSPRSDGDVATGEAER
jgi:hypothetical protein